MILRKRFKTPSAALRFGMIFLILGGIVRWLPRPEADFWRGVTEGVHIGVLLVAIGCMLISMRMEKHPV